MDERETKVVKQAIACGIQRGRELYTGSCFDKALKHAAEAAGVPLSDELLWELDARLDALVGEHNSLGIVSGQAPPSDPTASPLRPPAGPSLLGTHRLEARRRTLLESDGSGAEAPRRESSGGRRRCLLVAVFCLLLGAYAVMPHGRALVRRGYTGLLGGWRSLREALVGQDEDLGGVPEGTPSATAVDPAPPTAAPPASAAPSALAPSASPAPESDAAAVVTVTPPTETTPPAVPVALGSSADAVAPAEPRAGAPADSAPTGPTEPAATASGPRVPDLSALTPGMSRAAVVERLGKPRMAIGSNGRETLLYPFGRVVLVQGVVAEAVPQGSPAAAR